jgi:hypothetical protein
MTRVARLFVLSAVTFALGTLLIGRLGAAPTAVTTNSQTDFDELFVGHPCFSEDVHFTGTVHSSSHVQFNSTGLHLVVRQNWHVDGTGMTSGRKYEMMGPTNSMAHDRNDIAPPVVITTISRLIITMHGEGIVGSATVHDHVTVNPDGTTTSAFSRFELSCI